MKKTKLWVRILCWILAGLMIASMVATVIYAIVVML